VLFVADLLHPVDGLAVERLHDAFSPATTSVEEKASGE